MCDEDLEDMHKNKRDIMLWCSTLQQHSKYTEKSHCRKCSLNFDENKASRPTKRQNCAQKIQEVEAIVNTLKEKHGSLYSVEQLNAWGHMIHVGIN